jgi:acetyl-CoA carboxylase carboxyl transferase subunit alpha
MLGNRLIDGIIPEPMGGAHNDTATTYATFSNEIIKQLDTLLKLETEALINQRIEKFSGMGAFTEE